MGAVAKQVKAQRADAATSTIVHMEEAATTLSA